MSTALLIKSALLIDPGEDTEFSADLRVANGAIEEIGERLEPRSDEEVLDAQGLWISPGFIDMHTHLRDFGQADKEDLDTGTMAAAAGGFTTVLAMANTDPPLDSVAQLSLLADRIETKAHVEVLPVACVTRGMAGCELTDMFALASAGVAAFSDDGLPVANLAVLRRALEYATLADRLIISHAEDRDLSASGVVHEGETATVMGLPGIPTAAESAAVAAEIAVASLCGGRLHFAHISTEESAALIAFAKSRGLPVSADVTPHHLTLTCADIERYDTNYKMNPPLRTIADQKALVQALKDGTIEAIATDHAPHTSLEKARPFDQAPFGIIGLETAFALTYERLVLSGALSRLSLIKLLTSGPARLLRLPEPCLRAGAEANLVVIDPHHKWIYDARLGHSKSTNSPFSGRSLTGKPVLTISRGRAAFKDRELYAFRAAGLQAGSDQDKR